MDTWVIIASGPSLTSCDVDRVVEVRARDKIKGIIGVNNVMIDFPCDIGVAYDRAWIDAYWEDLKKFKGDIYSRTEWRNRTKSAQLPVRWANSGLTAMYVARDHLKAKKLILLGFDMGRHGNRGHYFGDHTRANHGRPLGNTDQKLFNVHIQQFDRFSGCEVVNCSRNSALYQFDKISLEHVLGAL